MVPEHIQNKNPQKNSFDRKKLAAANHCHQLNATLEIQYIVRSSKLKPENPVPLWKYSCFRQTCLIKLTISGESHATTNVAALAPSKHLCLRMLIRLVHCFVF